MWVRFLGDFDWKPAHHTTLAFKAGQVRFVRRAAAEAAIAAGKAIPTERPINVSGKASLQAALPKARRYR